LHSFYETAVGAGETAAPIFIKIQRVAIGSGCFKDLLYIVMFKINPSEVESFSLPKRQGTTAVLNIESRNKSQSKAAKLREATKASLDLRENEFSFLATALGQSIKAPVTIEENSLLPTAVHDRSRLIHKSNSGKSSDENEVSVIMAGIQTSDDAINFFARFGSETPVKFVHLIQDPDSKVYNPYELKVTQLHDPMVEHYTMSSAGIVHICPGEPSDCIPLSAWMRQGMMFKILRNIPFYKAYLHRKAFSAWRDNVRFQLFAKQRKKLAERMFYAKKNACKSILDCKKILIEVQSVDLLNLDLKTCDKDAFIDHQSAQCMKANGKFDTSMGSVCNKVQHMIQEVNSLYSLSKQNSNSNSMGYGDGVTEKTKSLVKLKQEKAEKKLLRQRAKLEHNTLPEFIRLVDYMGVETLVTLAINTTSAFYEELTKVRKAGVFETMVRFSSVGTTFSPTCQEISEMLERLLDSMINAVGNVSRVSYLNSNKALSATGPNIQIIIRESKQFRETYDRIQHRVINDFDKAEEHAQNYESVRPIYDFNVTWNFEAYRAQYHDISSLKYMMELIGNWSKELEKLRNRPIGILEVDSKRLKGELNPLREARLQEIKEYIKDTARYVCSSCRYSCLDLYGLVYVEFDVYIFWKHTKRC
jgi:dynein heavy chain